MRGEGNSLFSTQGAVLIAVVWLSLLTVLTLFEVVERPVTEIEADGASGGSEDGGLLLDADVPSLVRGSHDLHAAISKSKEKLQQLLDGLQNDRATVRRRISELRRQKNIMQQQQAQTGDADAARRLRAGYLEDFPHLADVEQLVGASLVPRSYSPDDVRRWRGRAEASLAELAGSTASRAPQFAAALGGSDMLALQRYVKHLEEFSALVDQMWPEHFDANGGAPVYRPLFAADSVEHPSNEEGIRLHKLYNSRRAADP
jgi:hypothetical protein